MARARKTYTVFCDQCTGAAPQSGLGKREAERWCTSHMNTYAGHSAHMVPDQPRQNPPLVVFGNPPSLRVVAVQSARVYEVAYRHLDDGKDYKHKFGPGVAMQLLADGSIRLYHENGKPLFGDF